MFRFNDVLSAGVRFIDTILSKSLGIYVFCDDPVCIMRIQLARAPHTVSIGNQRILKGEPVLGLHAWNERMPKLPKEGANLVWALRLRKQVVHSFMLVAKEMVRDARYSQVRAVFGSSAVFSFSDHVGGTRLMQHFGFTVLPYHRPFGRFGEFWENLFSWWLMWAYNTSSLRSRQFWRLQRTEIWITKDEFLRRFG